MSEREPRRDSLGRDVYLLSELVANRLVAEFELVVRSEGLSAAQYPVLWVVCLHEDPIGITQGAISDGLINRTSDVSRLVTRLEAAGLLERRASSADGRVVLVRPTDLGRSVFERVTERVKVLHRTQFADFDDEELKQLRNLLNRTFWAGVVAATSEAAS